MNPSKIQKTDNAMSSKKSSTEPQNMILRRKLKVKEPEGNTVHDDDFNKGPWLSMLEHLSLPPFVDKHSSDVKLLRYPISYVISKGFRDKVPLMVVFLKKFTATETDASVIVKDPTGIMSALFCLISQGDMEGTVHKQVLESYPDIGTGSVVVLRKVSVFNPTPFSHYLNITKQNIICIFPSSTQVPNNSVHLKDPKCIYHNEKEASKVQAPPASQKQTTTQSKKQQQSQPPPSQQQKPTQQKQEVVVEEESVDESSLIEEQLALEEELLLQNNDEEPFW